MVEQCFVRYFCYRTPNLFLYFFPVLRPSATSFAPIMRLLCLKKILVYSYIFFRRRSILCGIVTQKRVHSVIIWRFFFIHFHFLAFSFCNYMDQLCNNSLNNEVYRLQNIPPISQRSEVYIR